jgi:hypothetical protein
MVMGVNWHQALVGGVWVGLTRIVDINTFEIPQPNPISSDRDEAPEDQLLQESTLEVLTQSLGRRVGNSAIITPSSLSWTVYGISS